MTQFIILFGTLTLLTGLVIFINPDSIFSFLKKYYAKIELHIAAVVLRVILGIFLIVKADTSEFPIVIEVIGWISIIAGIFFAGIGRENFKSLMSWSLSIIKPMARIGGIIAAIFGAFLIYAFI